MMASIENRAAFIAGCPRSGTTLMTALLDNHPDLLVFPEEYLYVQPREMPTESSRNMLGVLFKDKVLQRLQGEKSFLDELHAERRNYGNFDNRCFEDAANNYFRIMRDNDLKPGGISVAAIALISLMYGFERATGKGRYTRWVVKHPHYELHWQQLFADFPDARMIYMVRDPRDVVLSRTLKRNKKRYLKRGGNGAAWKSEKGSLRISVKFLKEWERSVMVALRISESAPGHIFQVRYEDLVSAPRDVMRGVSRFLGVPWHENLATPSFLGTPWKGNSMQGRTFEGVGGGKVRGKHQLGPHHVWQIETWLGDVMIMPPGKYVPSGFAERINVKGLLSWLRGEGIVDFFQNRLRMVSNQRNWCKDCGVRNSPASETRPE